MTPRGQYRHNPAAATEKRCPVCAETKPVEQFSRNKAELDGRQSRCKLCFQAGVDQAGRLESERRRLSDPVKAARSREMTRRSHLRRRYGITLEQYDDMLVAQAGRCAICCQPTKMRRAKGGHMTHPWLAVDHCHKKSIVRGLLCFECNAGLARHEVPGWPALATAYLEDKEAN